MDKAFLMLKFSHPLKFQFRIISVFSFTSYEQFSHFIEYTFANLLCENFVDDELHPDFNF